MSPPYATNTAEAWSLFWSGHGRNSRCLGRSPDLSDPLDEHWSALASRLSNTARVLDLGCGSGAVGRALRETGPQLAVTGVDIARVPGSASPGLRLLSNVAMETLPFPECSFDCAVSQFGYEYGDPVATSTQVARVLVPRGRLSLLVHHPDGPVLAAMRRHRRAIEGLCGVRVQAAFFSGDARALSERIALLKSEVSNDSLIEEAGRGLHSHIRSPELGRMQVWRAVVDALAPELVMLDSLALCCVDDRSIENLLQPLATGFELQPRKLLRTRSGEALAWVIEGVRRP